jgi:hypothetical protein
MYMKLSPLQRYILRSALNASQKTIGKPALNRYYDKQSQKPSRHDMATIVTKSVDRLIAKDLLIGYGRKTSERMFVDKIKLTSTGAKLARKLMGEQQKLPLK